MLLGLDIEDFPHLSREQQASVAAWVIRNNIGKSVRYELVDEAGRLDVLLLLTYEDDRVIPLRWSNHGACAVLLWRRGIQILEPPPVVLPLAPYLCVG